MNKIKYQGESTYLNHDHYKYEKANFKKLKSLINKKLRDKTLANDCAVLDIGCATGALINYLQADFPQFKFQGIDISSKLISVAKKRNQNASFIKGNILSISHLQKFNLILCFGVLGIFDDINAKKFLLKIIQLLKPGGFAYIFHQFNNFNLDVLVRHRRTDPGNRWKIWGSGWNIYSQATIKFWLQKKCKKINFIEFKMPYAIKKSKNPIRTWTEKYKNNQFQLTNGLKLLVDLQFLEISN